MNSKTLKRQRDLKNKLMAAISMLLVSSIMLVTSTYAWFTLSTAPEVTGITTAVGANGNLEMALLPLDGQTSTIDTNSGVGSSIDSANADIEIANASWGNLVDLSNTNVYGLDKITLFPSALNLTGNTLQTALLTTPEYGADGRVSELKPNTVTGVYNDVEKKFYPDSGNSMSYGVRAVGNASGMTDRQLDYRNARSAANTARIQAADAAAAALNNNGSALANIAIEYGMDSTNAKYDKKDIAALRAIITALKGDEGVFELIEKAYMQYILAYAASAASGTEDATWLAVKGYVENANATLSSVVNSIGENNLPSGVAAMITDYNNMVSDVNSADTALTSLESSSKSEFTWEEIRTAMTPLVDPSQMEINGYKASEVKNKLGELVSSVTAQGGLKVIMKTSVSDGTKTSAGVFADIADHTLDYSASVNIERVEYGTIVLNNMAARMETDSCLDPNYYLVVLGESVLGAGTPASGAAGKMPITDMYGYVVDLAFKTNAAESNLLLQQDAVDRIYTDNTNEETMGHGATMTFKATTTDFKNEQVKELMSAIRIVFFDPGTMSVINYAKLDTANATSGTDGWTAKICMYTISEGGEPTYTKATYEENSGKIYYQASTQNVDTYTAIDDATAAGNGVGQLYITNDNGTTYNEVTYTENSGLTYYTKSTTSKNVYTAIEDSAAALVTDGNLYIQDASTAGQEVIKEDNVIMPLTQNTAHKLSVLVYLDGTKVTNGSVAATAATSMTGSMNLQFASSATLVPMDYADLHTPSASTESGTTYEVTVPVGVNGATTETKATVTANTAYTFTVDSGYTLNSVTVGGTAITTPNADTDGKYTIPAESVKGNIVINVSDNQG